jgi:hypothetical protein
MNKPADRKQWYIGNWTGLGWLETVIKGAAFVVAFYALTQIPTGSSPALNLIVILLGFITLAYLAAIFDRWLEKEIIALVFVFINVAAHAAMTWSVANGSIPIYWLGVAFALLMLIGDLVKIVFLIDTTFTVRGVPTRILVGMTAGLVVAYGIIALLLWIGTAS